MERSVFYRFTSGFLALMLFLSGIHADKLEVSVVTEKEKTLRLAERMESYGYHKSALHYYKMAQLDVHLSKEEREKVESKIEAIQGKLAKSDTNTRLPDLDEMLHIDKVARTAVQETAAKERHEVFPKTRINKKKWIIGTLVVVGVGVGAYMVSKHLRKKDENQTSLQISF